MNGMWSSLTAPLRRGREVAPRCPARARRRAACAHSAIVGVRLARDAQLAVAHEVEQDHRLGVVVAARGHLAAAQARAARTRSSGVPRGLSSPSNRMKTTVGPDRARLERCARARAATAVPAAPSLAPTKPGGPWCRSARPRPRPARVAARDPADDVAQARRDALEAALGQLPAQPLASSRDARRAGGPRSELHLLAQQRAGGPSVEAIGCGPTRSSGSSEREGDVPGGDEHGEGRARGPAAPPAPRRGDARGVVCRSARE